MTVRDFALLLARDPELAASFKRDPDLVFDSVGLTDTNARRLYRDPAALEKALLTTQAFLEYVQI